MVGNSKISKTRVMVFGTFDVFHKGHKNFFKQARKLGQFLIVVVARDVNVLKTKGRRARFNEKQRLRIVLQCKLLDLAVLGGKKDMYRIIKKYRPQIIGLGYDQKVDLKKLKAALKKFNLDKTKIVRLQSYLSNKYKSSKIKINHHENFC